MAWLQQDPSGNYHICFRFGGKKFKRSLKTKRERTALSKKLRLEENVILVSSGRIELPVGVDVPSFLLSDGKLRHKISVSTVFLQPLFGDYFAAIPENGIELATLKMMQIHSRHLQRIMGKRFNLSQLSFSNVQNYVNARAKEPGKRGRNVSASTIKKELTTLRNVWKWAVSAERLPSEIVFPSGGIRYPKTIELPPFQTFEEVQTQTAGLDPESPQAKDLWASVFLSTEEINELLGAVKQRMKQSFIYPMFFTAAHTGARRSELLRSESFDITPTVFNIREKKRKKKRITMRSVPISKPLREVLGAWLDSKPASELTFCHSGYGSQSKPGDEISVNEANHHFQQALKGTRFRNLRGWHVFRHSFCSNCAASGVDQRVIDAWVGHTTDEMRRRYRHLFPNTQQKALDSVFS